MKLKYNFPLQGNIKFPMGIASTKGNRLYELKVKNDFISHVCVTISNYPKERIPKVQQLKHNKIRASVSIPSDPYWDDIVSDIRTMEGSLCIWGVKKIDLDYFEVEWLPESEEEKKRVNNLFL